MVMQPVFIFLSDHPAISGWIFKNWENNNLITMIQTIFKYTFRVDF